MLSKLHPWAVAMPDDWVAIVNEAQTEAEVEAVRRPLVLGCPYGSESWSTRTAAQLRLQATLRPRGRPRKKTNEDAPVLFRKKGSDRKRFK